MFRSSIARLLTFTEAAGLFAAAKVPPSAFPNSSTSAAAAAASSSASTVSGARPLRMGAALAALQEHERALLKDESLACRVAQTIVDLDASDDDTAVLLQFRSLPGTASSSSSSSASSPASAGAPIRIDLAARATPNAAAESETRSPLLVLQLMRAFPSSPFIRERCCRCIANLCLLPPEAAAAEGGQARSDSGSGGSGAAPASVAQRLLEEEGALPYVLGTAAMAPRLSPRGRLWTALAALNLMCHAETAARAAGARGLQAETVLVDLLTAALQDLSAPDGEEGAALALATADATLGALLALLDAEAPENAAGITNNGDRVSYAAVEAVLRALAACSARLLRGARYGGLPSAPLSRRYAGLDLRRPSAGGEREELARWLPPLHKAWMVARTVLESPPNVPMVLEAVAEGERAQQRQEAGEGEEEAEEESGDGDVAEAAGGSALAPVLEAALFLTAEVEGVAEGAPEMLPQWSQTRGAIMAALEAVAAAAAAPFAAAQSTETPAQGGPAASGDAPEEAEEASAPGDARPLRVSRRVAQAVAQQLASGAVANAAVATLVRVHADHEEALDAARRDRKTSDGASLNVSARTGLAPYDPEDFTLLSKALLLCNHLSAMRDRSGGDLLEEGAEAQAAAKADEAALAPLDTVVSGPNGIAALAVLLRASEEALGELPRRYGPQLAGLFAPEGAAAPASSPDSSVSSASVLAADRVLFLQHAALAGQVYAVLWSLLAQAGRAAPNPHATRSGNTAVAAAPSPSSTPFSGPGSVSDAILEQDVLATSARLESHLALFYLKYKREAEEQQQQQQQQQLQAAEGGEGPSPAAETVVKLSEMSAQFNKQLKSLQDLKSQAAGGGGGDGVSSSSHPSSS